MKDGGAIVGPQVFRIVNELSAATAIALGLDKKVEDNIAAYDTVDASILTINNGVFEILSTAGDTQVRGVLQLPLQENVEALLAYAC